MNRAPHIFLVPQALDPHGRHFRRVLRNQFIESLPLPEGIVGRMFDDLLGPWQLVKAMQSRIIARRSRPAEGLIVVVGIAATGSPSPLCRLAREVIEVGLAKGAVVKPVVAHPSVHHGAFWSSDLQRGVRIEQAMTTVKPS